MAATIFQEIVSRFITECEKNGYSGVVYLHHIFTNDVILERSRQDVLKLPVAQVSADKRAFFNEELTTLQPVISDPITISLEPDSQPVYPKKRVKLEDDHREHTQRVSDEDGDEEVVVPSITEPAEPMLRRVSYSDEESDEDEMEQTGNSHSMIDVETKAGANTKKDVREMLAEDSAVLEDEIQATIETFHKMHLYHQDPGPTPQKQRMEHVGKDRASLSRLKDIYYLYVTDRIVFYAVKNEWGKKKANGRLGGLSEMCRPYVTKQRLAEEVAAGRMTYFAPKDKNRYGTVDMIGDTPID